MVNFNQFSIFLPPFYVLVSNNDPKVIMQEEFLKVAKITHKLVLRINEFYIINESKVLKNVNCLHFVFYY